VYRVDPIVPDAESLLRLRALGGSGGTWLPLMRISELIFESLTRRESQDPAKATLQGRGEIRVRRPVAPKSVNDGTSRSRE
jgi:hypothetical protein